MFVLLWFSVRDKSRRRFSRRQNRKNCIRPTRESNDKSAAICRRLQDFALKPYNMYLLYNYTLKFSPSSEH